MDGGMDTQAAHRPLQAQQPLPEYLLNTYTWAYLTPLSLRLLDNTVIPTAILWGNLPRLVRYAAAEFKPGDLVLQAACVYGKLSATLAERVGLDGFLDVIDIAPIQVTHTRKKLAGHANARVRVADAAVLGGGPYDGVLCFFLLHEVPDDYKYRIVDALLRLVPVGGRVVFVDYHNPAWWHPLRPIMKLVFHTLEPFAFGVLRREIRDFASDPGDFEWTKETFFGGLYQKIVAVRRRES